MFDITDDFENITKDKIVINSDIEELASKAFDISMQALAIVKRIKTEDLSYDVYHELVVNLQVLDLEYRKINQMYRIEKEFQQMIDTYRLIFGY